jgi:SAM-dependent methyltransferase
VSGGWEWDPSLYEGSAPYYATGRLPYPEEIAIVLKDELALDGRGRLLDVGCGPGSLTLVLSGLFDEVVGIDADAGMIAEARRHTDRLRNGTARWIHGRAESLSAAEGAFRMVTLAQSFHWMERPRVAALLFSVLEPGGALVHVAATTHRGSTEGDDLPGPTPPRDRIDDLVRSYLGRVRRAGRGHLPAGTASDEDEVLAGAGFTGPRRHTVAGGQLLARTEDDVVASVFSLSSAAPHLFADQLEVFETALRALLREVSTGGEFWERTSDVVLSIWERPFAAPSVPGGETRLP